ncbi:Myb-like protein J [Gracilariopsis chorda]|uniref:Myb-like protein J n=1 Tax=Gracilariopsis chorda TaxID=448386 RepID=A0A2V3IFM2_9FLOR|nr:Myb-like protein J [Gracilariopsis chorda]|eukprot:PXF40852.1 Myb-like protein J [Gracilariopsis chorda]
MDPPPSRPDLFSHILSQPTTSNYHLPPVQSAPKLSPLTYPPITNNSTFQPPSASVPALTPTPTTQHFSSQPFTRTYQPPLFSTSLPQQQQLPFSPSLPHQQPLFSTSLPKQQPLLSNPLPQQQPLSPSTHIPAVLPTAHPFATNSSLTHPTATNLPSPTPTTALYPFPSNLPQHPQKTAPHTASRYTLPGPSRPDAPRLTPSRSTNPDRALYNIHNILNAGCVIDSGNIYNSDGHIICGVSNQHDKPCRRVGKCPFHLYKAPVSASNSTNGVVDHKGTAVVPQTIGNQTQQLAQLPNLAAPHVNPLKVHKRRIPPKRQYKHGWSREEHYLFLEGLDIYGRGCWKQIAVIVASRSPTQVQSHAQKHDQRNKQVNKNKRSIHDLTLDSEEMKAIAHKMRNDVSSRAVRAVQRIESARNSRSGCALVSPLPQAHAVPAPPTITGAHFNLQQAHGYQHPSVQPYAASAAVTGMTGAVGVGSSLHVTQQASAMGSDACVQTNVTQAGGAVAGVHELRTAYQTGNRTEMGTGAQASTSASDGMMHGMMMNRPSRAGVYEAVPHMSDTMRNTSVQNSQASPLVYNGIKGSTLGFYGSYGMQR